MAIGMGSQKSPSTPKVSSVRNRQYHVSSSLNSVQLAPSLTHVNVEDGSVVGGWGIEDCYRLHHEELHRCPRWLSVWLPQRRQSATLLEGDTSPAGGGVLHITESRLFSSMVTMPLALTLREFSAPSTRLTKP